ncbi:MAG: gliding motility-associated C-terminal domain-containing protein, partial [Cytophagaceae bacterium]
PPVSTTGGPPAPGALPREYTIEAGTTQTIPITATQRDSHPLTLTASSELLDGVGGFNATLNGNPGTSIGLTGSAAATGIGSVVGTFVYAASCTEARTTPYDITVEVRDDGCAGKTIYDVFRITVVNPTGPKTITGDAVVCAGSAPSSYTAGGGASGSAPGVTWSVTGGTIVGSATANPVQVQWATSGTLTVRGVSVGGCLTDAVTKNVTIGTAPTLAVAGNRTICPGTSTTITPSGAGTGATYTVTGGPVTGSGPTFVLTPTATTTYTVTSTATAGSCASTAQVTITVNPAVVAVAGAAVATASGQPVTIGVAPVAGNTYSWSPATGLSSSTAANPTVTLTNTTGAPLTQTYTLTTTSTATGCSGTASVVVTVAIAVDPTLAFYNIITPNGDGLNDKLQIKNAGAYPGSTVEIYNRWGRQVFATTSYDNNTNYWGTDPTITSGTYYYIFKQTNGTTTKGWVQVVK